MSTRSGKRIFSINIGTVEAFLRDHDYNPYIDAENPLPTPSTQEAPIPNAGTPTPVDNGHVAIGNHHLFTMPCHRQTYKNYS